MIPSRIEAHRVDGYIVEQPGGVHTLAIPSEQLAAVPVLPVREQPHDRVSTTSPAPSLL